MHPRNRHQDRYDLNKLIQASPELEKHVFVNQYQDQTLDFSNPESVKALNQALLKTYYQISYWDLPSKFLCPPIPGRADYIHYLADLVGKSDVTAWDVGVGANCVYPLIGTVEYKWRFIGSEIDAEAFANARKIVTENKLDIDLRLQPDPKRIFTGIIKDTDKIDVTLCNPPFHESAKAAMEGTLRKNKNLGLKKDALNFGGRGHELWTEGGEFAFVSRLIEESALYQKQVRWFTSLVSKKENLPGLKNKIKDAEVRIIEMSQGQKISRILAWRYK